MIELIEITPEIEAGIPLTRGSRNRPWLESEQFLVVVGIDRRYDPDYPRYAFGGLRQFDSGAREWYATGFSGGWKISHFARLPSLPEKT